jgi:hypothetical protein
MSLAYLYGASFAVGSSGDNSVDIANWSVLAAQHAVTLIDEYEGRAVKFSPKR